jgi:hypothetical protein
MSAVDNAIRQARSKLPRAQAALTLERTRARLLDLAAKKYHVIALIAKREQLLAKNCARTCAPSGSAISRRKRKNQLQASLDEDAT